ncbi:lipase family protein [Corynebacterium xerosis]|uniref:lipase family protein n=1 Tax=Corynebacterium xerosis TaxID=1725 RepID=UPI0015E0F65C|nr:lipase family protein [Corynebacterium xerosis]
MLPVIDAAPGTVLSSWSRTSPGEHAGQRPTVVVAPGTVGQADKCAPSVTYGELGGGQISQVQPLLGQGFRVVVSDYIGLGAPGVHTYANRLDQGQTFLDAARAGLAIDGLPADSPVAFWGYSQGGGATASAAACRRTSTSTPKSLRSSTSTASGV